MDDRISTVLDLYHTRMQEECTPLRKEPPGGHDQCMRAIGGTC
jgi:hypothetical protein